MAIVHEQLYQSTDLANIDFNNYIRTLVNSLISFYEKLTRNISLKIDIDDIALGVDTAIPCGLVINELVTNSLKHAFPDGREGEIIIIVKKLETAGEKNIDLTVSDNGIGIPEGLDIQNTKSLGLKLVTTLIEHQLQGSFELKSENGTAFHMRFKELEYKKRL
jgi:two-component sensor histidine kinase